MPAGRTLFGIVEDVLAAIRAGDDRILILLRSIDFVVVLVLEFVRRTAVLPPIVVFGFDHLFQLANCARDRAAIIGRNQCLGY